MFRKLTFNTFAASFGRVVGGALGLVSIGFITRALGTNGFGEYSTIVAYLATFQILADLGLYSLLTKEISQNPRQEKELFSQFFTLRLLVAAVFLLAGIFLVFLFPYSTEVKLGVILASSAFLFMSLTQLFMSVFQKYLQIYKAAFAEIVGRVAQLGFVWFFFTRGGGIFHYLGTIIIGAFVVFVLDLVLIRKLVKFKLKASLFEWKRIVKTSYPIALSIVFTVLYFKADTLILSVLRSQEDVGIYNAAYKVLEVLIFFPAAFVGLLLPVLSKYAKENRARFSRLLSRLSDVMTVAVFPVVVGGILLSSSIVYYIGGVDFLLSALPLQILFLAIGIIFYGTLYGNSVIALDLQKKAMWAYVFGFIFNFVGNILVIPSYSYVGAAWTTVLTEFLVTSYLIWVIRHEIKFGISLSIGIRALVASIFMGVFVFYFASGTHTTLPPLRFLGIVAAGGAVYVFLALILKLNRVLPRSILRN